MNAESLRTLLKSQPFEPFEIRMTNGDSHEIRHPEMAFIAGARLIVYTAEMDRMVILSMLHIAAVQTLQPAER